MEEKKPHVEYSAEGIGPWRVWSNLTTSLRVFEIKKSFGRAY